MSVSPLTARGSDFFRAETIAPVRVCPTHRYGEAGIEKCAGDRSSLPIHDVGDNPAGILPGTDVMKLDHSTCEQTVDMRFGREGKTTCFTTPTVQLCRVNLCKAHTDFNVLPDPNLRAHADGVTVHDAKHLCTDWALDHSAGLRTAI